MRLVGYSFKDLLPAYPQKDEAYIDQLARDHSLCLNRPVIAYGLLGIRPCSSNYFNITEHGYRSSGKVQPWPPNPNNKNIFFFGGSSALGYMVEDNQTISACMQNSLTKRDKPCQIYNFGSGNYTSRHELLRLLDLIEQGTVPDHVIFLDGYNDCQYALGNTDLVLALDTLYQREKRRRRHGFARAIFEFLSLYLSRTTILPTSDSYSARGRAQAFSAFISDESIKSLLARETDELGSIGPTELVEELARMVWNKYLTSLELISSLAKKFKIKTTFIWQPVPFISTRLDQRILERIYLVYRYGAFTAPVYSWLKRQGYPTLNKDFDFIDCSDLARNFPGIAYMDHAHYSPAFSKMIGEELAQRIQL